MKNKRVRRNVIGKTIHALRMAKSPKVTQDDMVGRLARFGVELNQSQIAKIESGERMLLDYEIIGFAKALRVPVQDLFG